MARREELLMADWEFAFTPQEPVTADVGMAKKEETLELPEGLALPC